MSKTLSFKKHLNFASVLVLSTLIGDFNAWAMERDDTNSKIFSKMRQESGKNTRAGVEVTLADEEFLNKLGLSSLGNLTHIQAQAALGWMCYKGLGCKQNDSEALAYLKEAADSRDSKDGSISAAIRRFIGVVQLSIDPMEASLKYAKGSQNEEKKNISTETGKSKFTEIKTSLTPAETNNILTKNESSPQKRFEPEVKRNISLEIESSKSTEVKTSASAEKKLSPSKTREMKQKDTKKDTPTKTKLSSSEDLLLLSNLENILKRGLGNTLKEGDIPYAIASLEERLTNGDFKASLILGLLYAKGFKGIVPDSKKAAEFLNAGINSAREESRELQQEYNQKDQRIKELNQLIKNTNIRFVSKHKEEVDVLETERSSSLQRMCSINEIIARAESLLKSIPLSSDNNKTGK